jgi:hypothetical protein
MTGRCIHFFLHRNLPACKLNLDPAAMARAGVPEDQDPDLALFWRMPCDSKAFNRSLFDRMFNAAAKREIPCLEVIRQAINNQATCDWFCDHAR